MHILQLEILSCMLFVGGGIASKVLAVKRRIHTWKIFVIGICQCSGEVLLESISIDIDSSVFKSFHICVYLQSIPMKIIFKIKIFSKWPSFYPGPRQEAKNHFKSGPF